MSIGERTVIEAPTTNCY